MEVFHRCRKMKTFIKRYCKICKFGIEYLTGHCEPAPLFFGVQCHKFERRKNERNHRKKSFNY